MPKCEDRVSTPNVDLAFHQQTQGLHCFFKRRSHAKCKGRVSTPNIDLALHQQTQGLRCFFKRGLQSKSCFNLKRRSCVSSKNARVALFFKRGLQSKSPFNFKMQACEALRFNANVSL